MKLFYLPNLSAAMVQTKEIPDGETPHVPRCPDFGGDKTKYRAWWYPGRSRCYGICFSYEAARALAKNCPRNHAGFSGWQAKKEVA